MNASRPRPIDSSATVAEKPVMIPARSSRRTRSAAPWGLRPTSWPSEANDALPFSTSMLMIRKSVSSMTVVSTVSLADRCACGVPGEVSQCMRIGIPSEIKTDEYRVAITPAGVRELVDRGHEVLIQHGAGSGSAIPDEEYAEQGAAIVPDAAAVFSGSDMIVKVKEPQP